MKKKELYIIMFAGVFAVFALFAGCASTNPYEWTAVINPNRTIIRKRAFYEGNLQVVIISHGITTIESEAFAKNRLFRVHVPETCTEIAPDAFDKGVYIINAKDRPGEYSGDYKIIENETGVTITNYIGRNMYVVIPSEINGRQVTEIGQWAFAGKGLESVVIPDTVKKINDLAFEYNFLKVLTIPEGITELPNQVFHYNKLTSVTLPNSLTVIGQSAFRENRLSNVTLPDSLTTIGQNAFRNNRLSNVTLPNSLTTIEQYAFWNNNFETTVVIPDSVENLGQNVIPTTFNYTPSKENGWNRAISIKKFDGSNVDWIAGYSGNMLQPVTHSA